MLGDCGQDCWDGLDEEDLFVDVVGVVVVGYDYVVQYEVDQYWQMIEQVLEQVGGQEVVVQFLVGCQYVCGLGFFWCVVECF